MLLGYSESLLHPLNKLLWSLLERWVLELGVLPFALIFELSPLSRVESIGPEQPADLLFQFRDLAFLKSILEYL